jgi:hypothetical protein
MSRMGNLVLAIEEEVSIAMDPKFDFHPSELNMSRFEIAAKTLQSQGFYASASDCELVWNQSNEFCEL